jgi:DNA-binding transcriptional ArsR family regulator
LDPELNALFERVSSYFALLSEPTRLKILNSLCDGERSVSEIVDHTGASQPTVSRHLNLMYSRGALRRRREGPLTFYSVADETVVTLCRTVCVQVAGQGEDLAVGNSTLRRFMPRHDGDADFKEVA